MNGTIRNQQLPFIRRNEEGNLIIEDGFVTCVLEDGEECQVKLDEIDFNFDSMQLVVNDKTVLISLNENNNTVQTKVNYNMNKENTVIFRWCDDSTKLFITLYKETRDQLLMKKLRTKKALWETISLKMKEFGYDITNLQAENKYKSLERSYKNIICNNNKTGRGRINCPFETELSELLGSKHNISPLATSGKNGLITREKSTDTVNTSVVPGESEETEILEMEEEFMNDNEIVKPTCSNRESQKEAKTSLKNERKQIGKTARYLDICQKSITNLEESISVKCDIQKDILQQYKEISTAYQKCVEQLTVSNNFRKEKNEILKQLIIQQKSKINENFR